MFKSLWAAVLAALAIIATPAQAATSVAPVQPPQGVIHFGTKQIRMNGGYTGSQATAGNTVATAVTAEAPFYAVRLALHNPLGSPVTYDGVICAPSAQINNGYSPIDSSGAAVVPTAITFNNGGASSEYPNTTPAAGTGSISAATFTVAAMSAGSGPWQVGQTISGTGVSLGTVITALGTGTGGVGTYTVSPSQSVSSNSITGTMLAITIPPAVGSGSSVIPSTVYSDIVPLSYLARSDTIGALPLLFCRIYASAGGVISHNAPGTFNSDWPTVNGGRIELTYYKGGAVNYANLANFNSFVSPTAYSAGLYMTVEYYGTRGASMVGVGDSLTQGKQSTSTFNTWGHQLELALSTQNFPLSWANFGHSGMISDAIYQRAARIIRDEHPDIIFIPPWSPNDSPITDATLNLSLAKAVALADYATRNGTVPILTTPMPFGYTASGAESARLSLKAKILALQASGYKVCDFDTAVSDNGSGANAPFALFKVPYDSGDHNHPNDAGYAALAVACKPIVQGILAAHPQ